MLSLPGGLRSPSASRVGAAPELAVTLRAAIPEYTAWTVLVMLPIEPIRSHLSHGAAIPIWREPHPVPQPDGVPDNPSLGSPAQNLSADITRCQIRRNALQP